jgi:lipoprotein-releasing system permease protein
VKLRFFPFELSIAWKYLIPKKRSLSTALISLLSLFVITLVVWLIVVFLSVTMGIEKNWLKKLTTLQAPVRIYPTDHYFNSYYYLIDQYAYESSFENKTLGDKLQSKQSDPYNPEFDMELPKGFPAPDKTANSFIDPVKGLTRSIDKLKKKSSGISYQEYLSTAALLKIKTNQNVILSQVNYIANLPEKNPDLGELLVKDQSHSFGTWDHSHPILLPISYQKQGITTYTKGKLVYTSQQSLSNQEQEISVYIAGFYDPGVLPVGGRVIFTDLDTVKTISAQSPSISLDQTPNNGFFLWIKPDFAKAPEIANTLKEELKKSGIEKYWTVETFYDFSFSKALMQQFQSDRTLFIMIAAIIIVVACSNVISFLVVLVNDKKREIAILRAMGATKKSIATIFGIIGITVGSIGTLIGTALGIATLKNLSLLTEFLSKLQGHTAFHPAFFGDSLPNTLSSEALWFIFIITPFLSLLAGMIPAIKASSIRCSQTLREG